MKHSMKKPLFLITAMLLFASCAKEEFVTNKGKQGDTYGSAITTTNKLCSQSTLISPQVDILMLWDNTSSFNFVNSSTKASMSSLISSVSESFDYHVLSAPLVPTSTANLFESQLVVKNNTGLGSSAVNIVKSKDAAIASLGFTQSNDGSREAGIDRAIQVIEANRSNGIFRNGAYTIIVVISNEDDKACDISGDICNNPTSVNNYLTPRVNKLLCMRGNTTVDCSATGYSSSNSLSSAMMRFINISPLTKCASGNNFVNTKYRQVAKSIYEASYTNGWPTSNDALNPFIPTGSSTTYPDSYNLCSMSFTNIFDGVNTAIKQTLLKHKYDYWPVAGADVSIDPSSIRVERSDGKVLSNRVAVPSTSSGYELIVDAQNEAATVTYNTRFFPTAGEPFTGKMIRLYGVDRDDKIVYPDCLTITYEAKKLTFGYIHLTKGLPKVDTIEVYLNGAKVPADPVNGWDYMGTQMISALDPNLKVVALEPGAPSGIILRLNGTYKVKNNVSNKFEVYYTSVAQ